MTTDLNEPIAADSSSQHSRSYLVLEETTLLELLREQFDVGNLNPEVRQRLTDATVYRQLGTPEARNTEHAVRQVAKDHFEQGGEPLLVPVPVKMWRPTRVRVRRTQTVTID